MKNFLSLLAFNFIFSIIYAIISGFGTYSFINCAFIIGMFYFLSGAMCFVWEKGFFNITTYAFNKLGQHFQKNRGTLTEDASITIDDYINRKNKFFLTYNLLFAGLLISVGTVCISFTMIS